MIKLLTAASLSIAGASIAQAAVVDRPFFENIGIVIVWGSDNFSEAGGAAPIVSDFVRLDNVASGTEGNDFIANNVGTVATGSLQSLNRDSPTIQDGTSRLIFDGISGQSFGGDLTDNSPTGLLNAADTLTAFGVEDGTDVGSQGNTHNASFFVASNTAFDINGQLFNPIATGDFLLNFSLANISYAMDVTVTGDDDIIFGTAAQDPSLGGQGPLPGINSLASFGGTAGEIKVYDGGRRTAVSPGSISEQSVRFDLTYALDGDEDVAGIQPFDLSSGSGTISMFMVYTIFAP